LNLVKSWIRLKCEHIEPDYDPVLLRFDFAPLIATICDEEVRVEVAWRFPSWLYNRLGNLDLETLLRIKDYRSVLEESEWYMAF
jgi:hypothetical protein